MQCQCICKSVIRTSTHTLDSAGCLQGRPCGIGEYDNEGALGTSKKQSLCVAGRSRFIGGAMVVQSLVHLSRRSHVLKIV